MRRYYTKKNVVRAIQFELSNIEEIGKQLRKFELAFNIDGDTPFLIVRGETVRQHDWLVFNADGLKIVAEDDFDEYYGLVK